MIRAYYQLTKPGIIYGNLLTAAAGFLLASKWHIAVRLFAATLGGTSLVIASACVFNNYIDRELDKQMARTKQRALVQGTVSGWNAIIYASLLGVIGFLILGLYTNWLVTIIGAVAFFDYIVLYGIAKRRSVHGTLVGSIAGAAPVVAGYCAVTDRFDGGAVILFLILATWQMPHFYAIAIRRQKDYKAAGLPVLPVKQGIHITKIQIVLYISTFIGANILLSAFGYTAYTYAIIMTLVGLAWLHLGLKGFGTANNTRWARQMFLFSLLIITSLSVMLSVGAVLP